MLSFVLAASRNGQPLPHQLVDHLCGPGGEDHLAFLPDRSLAWMGGAGTILVRAWERRHPALDLGPRWRVDGARLTAFAGLPVPRAPVPAGRWCAHLAGLADLATSGRLPDARAGLRGAYVLVELDAGRGGTVCADPLGGGILYAAEHPAMAVVANRASLAGWAASPGTAPKRDAAGLGWLLTLGGFLGDETGLEGVRALAGNAAVAVDASGCLTLSRAPSPATGQIDGGEQAVAAAADEVAGELAGAVADVSRLPGPLRIGLTGGRDSRLVLAAALAAGVERRFAYHTTGAGGGGDLAAAGRIAAGFGLEHTVSRGSGKGAGAEWLEDEVRSHAHQTCGLVPAKQLSGKVDAAPFVFVDGCLGECLRAYFGGHRRLAGTADVDVALDGLFFRRDRGGLCRPEAEAFYREAAGAIAAEAANGVAVENVLHALFALRFDRRSVGTLDEAGANRPRVHPLASPPAMAISFRVGHDARRHQRLHLEALRRLHEPLARLPLVGDPWPAEALARLPPSERGAYPTEGLGAGGGLAGLRGSSLSRHRPVFERLLLDDASNPVFAVVDRDRAIAAVRAGDEAPPAPETVRALYNALGVAVWLGGGERQRAGPE